MDDVSDFRPALQRMGLIAPGERLTLEPLRGGVSSDIFKAVLPTRVVCIKRALPKLKVKANWQAPVERNRYEVQWMRTAAEVVPESVPEILGEDQETGSFAMAYLDPETHPVWKEQLRDGDIDPSMAREVGRRLAAIHNYTAGKPEVEKRFSTDHIFLPIRLEPYLATTAQVHTDLAPAIKRILDTTQTTKHALVHGDVSPKNILAGPHGPVFLDAECAWYGDPAFDVAFCLNHLMLKCVWRPRYWARYLDCFAALSGTYLDRVSWEPRSGIEMRIAKLLPALFLARVDGKSPVEYITDEQDKNKVRHVARTLILSGPDQLPDISSAWRNEIALWRHAH